MAVLMGALALLCSCGTPRIHIQRSANQQKNPNQMIPAVYRIGPGDELEILYHISPDFTMSEYVIETEDTIRVDFYYYPVLSRTVRVRPDGFITLPRVGDIKVAGEKPKVLAERLEQIYTDHLSKPTVTVEVIGFDTKANELKKAITTDNRGQSRLVVVAPDGKISLPYVPEISASGLTSYELSREIEKKYRKFIANIGTTVAVLQAHSNRVYVMGEVKAPMFFELPGPVTLTQVISAASGFTREANTHQVVIISRSPTGQPDATIVDMDDIIGEGDFRADPMMKQYDVIFVPRTKLASGALVGESLWRMIPLSFSGGYSLGGKATK